ncbi:serine/threonine-protein kinase CTR1 [Elysia marginata]|uniref:Serine/threonine-protein kinase CTR1 n=1 Tax=Elysia marginata TaxID=1093978 RepID=A0AAV4JE45_9GAST|nr:serine/threonine-protein kinase CTR1 [Elysia marginata]
MPFYVDNPLNRRLGRVGLPHGTAVHIKGTDICVPKDYVDNELNRRLGRVGLPRGSEPHSRDDSSYSPGSWRTYLDKLLNQKLDSVIFSVDSAVSCTDDSLSMLSASDTSSSTRTNVEKPVNQKPGQVGLTMGPAVHSKDVLSAPQNSTSSPIRTNVEKPVNQKPGQVGLTMGPAVHSKDVLSAPQNSTSSPTRTNVDKPMNQKPCQVGLTMGPGVHSKDVLSAPQNSTRTSEDPREVQLMSTQTDKKRQIQCNLCGGYVCKEHAAICCRSCISSLTRNYVSNPMNQKLDQLGLHGVSAAHSKNAYVPSPTQSSSSSSTRVCVNNPINQKLDQVGLSTGSAVHSQKASVPSPTQISSSDYEFVNYKVCQLFVSRTDGKVYQDNEFNRRHNRVGLPLGSKPIKESDKKYADSAINRHLNRVGLPMGTQGVSKTHLAELRNWLGHKKLPSVLDDSGYYKSASQLYSDLSYPGSNEEFLESYTHIMESFSREREEDIWLELTGKSIRSSIQATDRCSALANIQGKPINPKDLKPKAKIGHGGFGEVYLAELAGQAVAVKILTQAKLSEKHLKLFENEIINHSKLDHPNIVKFFGPCLERPNLAIVMEYMDASLWDSLHVKEVDFPLIDKLFIIQDMVSGLDYLHSIPLVHADLKTQNVLLVNVPNTPGYKRGQPTVAKLSDFGLSVLSCDSETNQSTLTNQKQQPVGATFHYAAPEVIRGEMLDNSEMLKTDIYSMGLVIMELAVEIISFKNLSRIQLMEQVGQKGTKPCAPPGLTLHRTLEEMLHQCWSFEPMNRPDARQLRKMAFKLEGILEDEAIVLLNLS